MRIADRVRDDVSTITLPALHTECEFGPIVGRFPPRRIGKPHRADIVFSVRELVDSYAGGSSIVRNEITHFQRQHGSSGAIHVHFRVTPI